MWKRTCRICGKFEAKTLVSIKRNGVVNQVWVCEYCEEEHKLKIMLDRNYYNSHYRWRLRFCKKLCQMCLKNPVSMKIALDEDSKKKTPVCKSCFYELQRIRYSPSHKKR